MRTGGIVPYPSDDTVRGHAALMKVVNGDSHAVLLLMHEDESKRVLPDYVAYTSVEIDDPVLDAEGRLVGGSLVMTTPPTYHPTAHCRPEVRVAAIPPSGPQQARPPPRPRTRDRNRNRKRSSGSRNQRAPSSAKVSGLEVLAVVVAFSRTMRPSVIVARRNQGRCPAFSRRSGRSRIRASG